MKIKSLQNEQFHLKSNAKMVPFAGYSMPMWYSTIADEHNTVRDHVGIFDVSHMGEFFVTGDMAKDFLQMVTTNDINKLTKGKIHYSSILNRSGGIIDDLLVYDIGENKYMLVVNASNMEKDLNWLNENNNLDVARLGRGFNWYDTGTVDALFEATAFVRSIQLNQGIQVACPEEIAFNSGWISAEELEVQATALSANLYGKYLKNLLNQ